MSARERYTFWMAMHYGCERCGYEAVVRLEEGLEGPRDREVPVPRRMRERWTKMYGPVPPFDPASTIPATAGGRIVLPVPFVGFPCPRCQPGPPPWDMGGGTLTHVRWNADRRFNPRITVAPAWPHFRYPADPYADGACGEPVWMDPAPATGTGVPRREAP